ncbi:hypothetical protein O9H85_03045 [Paenibacillus filicis]|uniref:DUF3953 domain-containing protein n=1 Tax=Paenibacillus gyeongsangnamensis TaxID=3388067 RepID=A0ABT4Q3S4_9BACL|nr:hypothetical protein [Paenibacillus filicis]MCZ8511432.1 hypothetical protein [Paenibacillus filicis]
MRTLAVIGFSLVCALLLSLFSQIQDLLRYIFSLGALYAGIQFFRRYEGRGMRIAFVVTTVLFYFAFTVIIAMVIAMKQMNA